MLCPVCKTECGESTVCAKCGFEEVGREFVNNQDADYWFHSVVVPYKTCYLTDIRLEFVKNDDGSYAVAEIKDKSAICISIPAYYCGKPVTKISEGAFWECKSLFKIELPDTINIIDGYAFLQCEKLKKINLPTNLQVIGESAFCDCASLETIDIPPKIKEIPGCTFNGCINLKEIWLDVKSIGEYAFAGCKSLISFDSYYLAEIKTGAFEGCDNMKTFDATCINSIGDYAFSGCHSLKKLLLGSWLEHIGERAFDSCLNLELIDLTGNDLPPAEIYKSEWQHISKGDHWDSLTGWFTIMFSDGEVSKRNSSIDGKDMAVYYDGDTVIEMHEWN